MRNRAYKKSIKREIISSKARFFSILVIIFLGVAFYSGIKSAEPDMKKAINKFYDEQNLMDSKIVSTLGLTDKDLEILNNDDKILDFYGSHTIDINLTNINNLVRFMEYDNENNINNFVVIEGRLPENAGEIALDERAFRLNKNFKIGDEYIIEADEDTMEPFNETKFKIVGIIRSPMYVEKDSRGVTSVGKGTIDYFAVLNSKDISMEVYTEIYLRFKNVQDLDAYGDEYEKLMEENNKYLEDLFVNRVLDRAEEVKSEVEKEFDNPYKEIEDQYQQIIAAEQLGYSNAELNESKQKLLEAKEEVENKEKEAIESIGESKYYFFDRTDNQGYLGYKDSIECLGNIASVLPMFFFLVAILICLTTMTRMVEENRLEIGTLKALGYKDLEISWKYIIYASIASILGSVLGILIGSTVLPSIISNAYESIYNVPKIILYYYPVYIIQSMAISILCTVGAALFVIKIELKSKPANLMRAKAPKIGKKILLERITPLWKRLSFNHKITLRNIFRYKQRMIMTVLGIAGCMALLVTGFGLKDSNAGMVDKEFNKIWKYEAIVILDENSSDEEYKKYNDTLTQLKGYKDSINIHQESFTFSKEGMNKQTATLYVPQNIDKFDDFILLDDRVSGEKYDISDNGVIITEKLSKLLDISVNDTITLIDENNNSYDVKVDKITENYVAHYLYMSPSYYQKIFNKEQLYNAQLINFNDDKESDDEISSKLLECGNVSNVTLKSQIQKTTEDSNDSMNLVMIVIIVAAGSLAFVVLYNLNNINVSERIRELSTIKVLGFFNKEVTMYISRENIILTLIGVIVGSALGKILHTFIINTAETDTMMMYPNISIYTYIFSALLTILFSVIVMILMHIKLKRVNMIDALKSNE
ncbi:ABC transporter permease [Clostridium sp. 1001271B_151109_B4]|uniref:ABC transporter permease n=1 Tax=Clostridium sp. 1001271B_151109_B4 TaxID=2787148 RepID=UPI0018AC06F2|nr:ABC transporter permease [Clostridium sp. 1001271B_151109_B4]